jgi:hypothetical protein
MTRRYAPGRRPDIGATSRKVFVLPTRFGPLQACRSPTACRASPGRAYISIRNCFPLLDIGRPWVPADLRSPTAQVTRDLRAATGAGVARRFRSSPRRTAADGRAADPCALSHPRGSGSASSAGGDLRTSSSSCVASVQDDGAARDADGLAAAGRISGEGYAAILWSAQPTAFCQSGPANACRASTDLQWVMTTNSGCSLQRLYPALTCVQPCWDFTIGIPVSITKR